jgi:ABC-type transporter Mla maintaining outer membrane lipid asymmetry ATPase subunit MlaF
MAACEIKKAEQTIEAGIGWKPTLCLYSPRDNVGGMRERVAIARALLIRFDDAAA